MCIELVWACFSLQDCYFYCEYHYYRSIVWNIIWLKTTRQFISSFGSLTVLEHGYDFMQCIILPHLHCANENEDILASKCNSSMQLSRNTYSPKNGQATSWYPKKGEPITRCWKLEWVNPIPSKETSLTSDISLSYIRGLHLLIINFGTLYVKLMK